jgi:hypothetical protein
MKKASDGPERTSMDWFIRHAACHVSDCLQTLSVKRTLVGIVRKHRFRP